MWTFEWIYYAVPLNDSLFLFSGGYRHRCKLCSSFRSDHVICSAQGSCWILKSIYQVGRPCRMSFKNHWNNTLGRVAESYQKNVKMLYPSLDWWPLSLPYRLPLVALLAWLIYFSLSKRLGIWSGIIALVPRLLCLYRTYQQPD